MGEKRRAPARKSGTAFGQVPGVNTTSAPSSVSERRSSNLVPATPGAVQTRLNAFLPVPRFALPGEPPWLRTPSGFLLHAGRGVPW